MSRLYLLDAGALGAWKRFSVGEGSHADLVEGVEQWWKDFVREYDPKFAVACMDCSRASNWRKKKYIEYKSGRDSKPKDDLLAEGMRALPGLFAKLGIPTVREEGFEADDLIATLSARHDGEVVIVTTDKDMHQLVDDRVRVYDPRPNRAGECIFFTPDVVYEKHHVRPNRIRELLAIMGDASDSIPGVKGWGKEKAVNAIKQTRSKLELLRLVRAGRLADITQKNQALFVDHLADFELSYELVGLRFDAPVPENFNTALEAKMGAA